MFSRPHKLDVYNIIYVISMRVLCVHVDAVYVYRYVLNKQ